MAVNKVNYGSRTLIDLTGDTVTPARLLSGYKAHGANGEQITGAITSKAAATYNVSGSNQTIAKDQYLSGVQTIRGVTTDGIEAANIKKGATVKVGDTGSATRIKNVAGTFSSSDTVSAGQTAAAAAQILAGYSAFVDGAEVKGGIPIKSSSDLSVSGATVTVPAGYYAQQVSKAVASGSVTQNAPTIDTTKGLVTATSTVAAGYVAAGTKSNTLQLSTQAAKTFTPTRSTQTAVAAGKYTIGAVKIAAIPSDYYLLTEVYPVGALWATEDSTKDPKTVLGFGTWEAISPVNATWDDLENSTWDDLKWNSTHVYVYKRTA